MGLYAGRSVPFVALHQTLRAPRQIIGRLAWSPDGQQLAVPSFDGNIYVCHLGTGMVNELIQHRGPVYQVAWSPDGAYLASASADKTVVIWDVSRRRSMWTYTEHHDPPFSVAYSPDGNYLASGGKDSCLRVFSVQNGQQEWFHQGFYPINCVAWSPKRDEYRIAVASQADIKIWNYRHTEIENIIRTSMSIYVTWDPHDLQSVFSTSDDRAVHVWNVHNGMERGRLEGHLDRVNCVTISADGKLIATKSADGTVKLWRSDLNHYDYVHNISEPTSPGFMHPSIAFHPTNPTVLATLGEKDKAIRFWEIQSVDDDITSFGTHYYSNAKIALVGESGVGKSSLADVMSGKEHKPNYSTQGRRVWSLGQEQIDIGNGRYETRETFIWDLAGQPGYRLIHPLHLSDVDVALIVIDASREVKDVFNNVHTWANALDAAAKRSQNGSLRKMLVFARTDVADLAVNWEDVVQHAANAGIAAEDIYKTSARTGVGVKELRKALDDAIDWEQQPKVSSTDLFQSIRAYLVQAMRQQVLMTADELFNGFIQSPFARHYTQVEDLPRHFITCIRLLESQNLIRRFRFGKRILLRPELLDSYAAAISFAALTHDSGFGVVVEDTVLKGELVMKPDDQLRDETEERFMLIETVRDLVAQEIAYRVDTQEGIQLVFPSQFTRELHEMPKDINRHEVVLSFEGNVLTVYATLVVRLAHSGFFRTPQMWHNAVVFHAEVGRCAIRLEQNREGAAALHLQFDDRTSPATRAAFEVFVRRHIEDRSVVGKMSRRPVFACPNCGETLTESHVAKRLERGATDAPCPVCETRIPLQESEVSQITTASILLRMGKKANNSRERNENELVAEGRRAANEYDVALLYKDRNYDRTIAVVSKHLKQRELVPWMEVTDVTPPEYWRSSLHHAMFHMCAAVIFVGQHMVPWQDLEMARTMREFADSKRPLITALLPGAQSMERVTIPDFMAEMGIVNFNLATPNPYERLADLVKDARRQHR